MFLIIWTSMGRSSREILRLHLCAIYIHFHKLIWHPLPPIDNTPKYPIENRVTYFSPERQSLVNMNTIFNLDSQEFTSILTQDDL